MRAIPTESGATLRQRGARAQFGGDCDRHRQAFATRAVRSSYSLIACSSASASIGAVTGPHRDKRPIPSVVAPEAPIDVNGTADDMAVGVVRIVLRIIIARIIAVRRVVVAVSAAG